MLITNLLGLTIAPSVTANGVYLTTPLTMRTLWSQRYADMFGVGLTLTLGKSSPSAKAGGVFFVNSDTGSAVNENPSRSKYDDIHIYFD